MICQHHLLKFVLCSLSSSSMCLPEMQSPFSLCCRYLGFFRAIGPITVAVLGIAITNIWHLECPTSDKNKVCERVYECVRACVCPSVHASVRDLCVNALSEAHGHATCPFCMLFAVHTTGRLPQWLQACSQLLCICSAQPVLLRLQPCMQGLCLHHVVCITSFATLSSNTLCYAQQPARHFRPMSDQHLPCFDAAA